MKKQREIMVPDVTLLDSPRHHKHSCEWRILPEEVNIQSSTALRVQLLGLTHRCCS